MTASLTNMTDLESVLHDRVTYGRCINESAKELGMQHQEYLWVEGAKMTREEMQEALEIWGLQSPNLIIMPIGAASSKVLYAEMLKHPIVWPMVQDIRNAKALAKRVTERTGSDENGVSLPNSTDGSSLHELGTCLNSNQIEETATLGSDEAEELIPLIQKGLEETIIGIFTALLAACEQTNSWLVIQYDGIGITDGYLHKALQSCPHRPVIMAFVDRTYWGNSDTEFWEALKQTKHLRAGKSQKNALGKLPVTCAGPGLACDNGNFPCVFATHFIFADSMDPYPVKALGPKGGLFVSGGSGVGRSIDASLKAGEPTILLLHSGRSCDFYGSAAAAMQKAKPPSSVTELLEKMGEECPFWTIKTADTEYLFDLYDQDEMVEQASNVFRYYNANPSLFNTSAVVLNAWKDNPYTVIEKISACFSAITDYSVDSLGSGGAEASEESLMTAWHMYDTLSLNCDLFLRRIIALKATTILLGMLTTFFAVYLTFVNLNTNFEACTESYPRRTCQMVQRFLHSSFGMSADIIIIVLPALGGLAAQFLDRFHYRVVWSSMYINMIQIEAEIFRFRSKTGSYKHAGVSTKEDKHVEGGKINGPHPREILLQNVSNLYEPLLCSNLRDSSLVTGSGAGELLTRLMVDNTLEAFALRKDDVEIGECGYGTFPTDRGEWNKRYSTLDSEDLFKQRVVPTLQAFQEEAPALASRLFMYEAGIFTCALASTLLASFGWTLWIPIPVALGACLGSFLSFEALQSRLNAMNVSIGELTALMGQWAAMGVMEKRSVHKKVQLVDVVENAIVRVASAYVSEAGYLHGAGKKAQANGEEIENDAISTLKKAQKSDGKISK